MRLTEKEVELARVNMGRRVQLVWEELDAALREQKGIAIQSILTEFQVGNEKAVLKAVAVLAALNEIELDFKRKLQRGESAARKLYDGNSDNKPSA